MVLPHRQPTPPPLLQWSFYNCATQIVGALQLQVQALSYVPLLFLAFAVTSATAEGGVSTIFPLFVLICLALPPLQGFPSVVSLAAGFDFGGVRPRAFLMLLLFRPSAIGRAVICFFTFFPLPTSAFIVSQGNAG